MYEAIVTLVYPATDFDLARTEVYRLEWDSAEAMENWLNTDPHDGLVSDQKMPAQRRNDDE